MHASWVLNSLGALVCHQIADRSFEVGGQALPLCARCTGVYAGFAMGVLALVLSRNLSGMWSCSKALTLPSIAIIFAFGLQGVGERFGFGRSSNEIRFMLGLLCGCAINLLLTPLAHYLLGLTTKNTTDLIWRYWLICGLLSSLLLVFGPNASTLSILSYVSIGGLCLMFAFLNAAIVSAVTACFEIRSMNKPN